MLSQDEAAPSSENGAPRGRGDAIPASFAALVPSLGALVHVVCSWLGPSHPRVLEPLLPLFVEVVLLWLPFGSLCAWFARRSSARPFSERAVDVLASLGAFATALCYFLLVRLPAHATAWSPDRRVTELYALWSSTTRGVPLLALGTLLGWAAVVTVITGALADLLAGSPRLRPRARALPAVLGLALFAVGASAVLRYATGSPWPLIG